jgi:hypothetical protein
LTESRERSSDRSSFDSEPLVCPRAKMKYLVVTGGVVSGLGKGISISSLGVLLKAAGLRVTAIKIDPYLVRHEVRMESRCCRRAVARGARKDPAARGPACGRMAGSAGCERESGLRCEEGGGLPHAAPPNCWRRYLWKVWYHALTR